MANIIEVENLTKNYGQGRGVFAVSFSVSEGEVFGFLGPNGAGKSTTIRHLMGFSRPESGTAKIFGKNTFNKYYEILGEVGYIPGEIALPAGLSGYEFIEMMRNMQGIKNDTQLNKMLDLFKLDSKVLKGDTKRMSLGVKRKLAVVTAFMHDPKVLILDEPTSGLDPVMQENFIQFVREEKENGKTVLLSSHMFSEVDATCDRIAIIKDGKIVSDFVANDLKHASVKYYNVVFDGAQECAKFSSGQTKVNCCKILGKSGASLFISTEDKDINKVIDLLSSCKVNAFTNVKETLEDYFMKFYREDADFGGAL